MSDVAPGDNRSVRPASPKAPRVDRTATTPAAPSRLSAGQRRGRPSTKAAATPRSAATAKHSRGECGSPFGRPPAAIASARASFIGQGEPVAQKICRPAIARRPTDEIRALTIAGVTLPQLRPAEVLLPSRRRSLGPPGADCPSSRNGGAVVRSGLATALPRRSSQGVLWQCADRSSPRAPATAIPLSPYAG